MILHRLLRQTKAICNFLVREPLRDQRNQLLLAPRQTQLLPHRSRRQTGRLTLEIIEQQAAKRVRTRCFPGMHRFQRFPHIFNGGSHQQITPDPSAHILQKLPLRTRAPVPPNITIRTPGPAVRTLRMFEISLSRFPQDVSSNTSGESSRIFSMRNISFASPSSISRPAWFASIRVKPSCHARLPESTRTRIFLRLWNISQNFKVSAVM